MRVANEYWVPLRLRPDDRAVPRWLRLIHSFAGSAALATALLVLFTIFAVKPTIVEGSSMEPALHNGQLLAMAAAPWPVRRGNIVVISGGGTQLGKPIIKRVIGLPGDQIDIDFAGGVVFLNGQPLAEPYAAEPVHINYDAQFPLLVPPGRCFVLGDNRNYSEDSRSSRVGLVDLRQIVGTIIMPNASLS